MPFFRGVKRWGIIISGVLLSSLLLAACGENSPSVLSPAGPGADRERILFWFILIVATIVFVAVEGMLIYSIFRYRERPNSPTPRQIHGNNTIEVIWTVAPSIFLFAVLVGTIYTMVNLAQPKTPADIEVRVVGHQWWWEFDYMHEHIVNADSLYVPTGAVVQLDLESNNVIHSFWVPELTGKTDVIPGHHNQMWLTADHPGTYRGQCAEYCGNQHAHMAFNVIAMDPNQFQTWVTTEQQKAATPAAGSLAEQGAKLFASATAGCTGCHGIVGVNLSSFDDPKANALIGPNLTHFGSRRLIAGGVLLWDPTSCAIGANGQLVNPDNCGLYQWLKDPQAVKPGNDMVIGQLTDTQITQLIAYLESLQ